MILFLHEVRDEYLQRLQRETGEKTLCLTDAEESQSHHLLSQAEIMIGFGTELKSSMLANCQQLKWFHSLSAGVEHLEFEALERRGVTVTNSSGIHGRQMAEQIFAMMLSFTRGLHHHLRNQQAAIWDKKIPVRELVGQTLVIVGAGRIGQEVARKAKAFDMRVIGVKRTPDAMVNFDEVVGLDELNSALSRGDFVLVLTPLTPATYHLIGEDEFSRMQETAVFLNYARGDVVDESALITALQAGQIAGAGLDVFHEEPLPTNHPFWSMNQVLITPHTSGSSPTYTTRALDLFVANFHLYRAGKALPNQVDLARKY